MKDTILIWAGTHEPLIPNSLVYTRYALKTQRCPSPWANFLKAEVLKKKKKTTIKPPSAIVETRLSENKIAFLEVSLTKCFTSEPRRRKEIESCSFFINGVTYATKHNGEINIPSGTQRVLKNKK